MAARRSGRPTTLIDGQRGHPPAAHLDVGRQRATTGVSGVLQQSDGRSVDGPHVLGVARSIESIGYDLTYFQIVVIIPIYS